MRPEGWLGRPFGWLMERMNNAAYVETLSLLHLKPEDRLLEIGFGTGAFLEIAAKEMGFGRLAGVDPSALMVTSTKRRLHKYDRGFQIDIALGDDQSPKWPTASFTHIVAIHSFQFWSDPKSSIRHIQESLQPNGMLCLTLRVHKTPAPDWLPNPLSRSGHEVERTIALLETSGFRNITCAGTKKTPIIYATIS